MELILTLDVGTTSVKACLFDRQLRQTALTSREYALQTRGVCAEVEAQVYLDAAAQCILALPAEARAKVCAVALTTQGETLLCVDRQGKALRPAIVWLDSRAEAQAARLAAALDRQRFYERTGLPELSGALPLAKLLWLREQEPESWARTDKFLLLEDYLMLWLTGRAVTEKSLLTSTGYFDLQSDDYWDEALALAELDRTRLPQALACGSIVGPVLPEVAEALGLPASACVVTGAMDQTAAALAAGCTRPGTLCETTGTAMVAAAFTAHPQFSEDHHVTIYRHAMPGAYLYLPISNTIGMSLRWFRDEFCRDLDGGYAALDRLAEQVPPGAQGVIPAVSGRVRRSRQSAGGLRRLLRAAAVQHKSRLRPCDSGGSGLPAVRFSEYAVCARLHGADRDLARRGSGECALDADQGGCLPPPVPHALHGAGHVARRGHAGRRRAWLGAA